MSGKTWGPIDIDHWQETPCLSGRVALEEDVRSGNAVFYLTNAEKTVEASPIDLPRCAILLDEESGKEIPVLVIQIEQAGDDCYVGYRFLEGGNGICTLCEVQLLNYPDRRFFASKSSAQE